MEKRKVFDFTKDDIDDNDIDAFVELNSKTRKSYSLHKPNQNKIKITFVNEENEEYDVIYVYAKKEQIYQMIIQGKELSIKGYYINNFNISEFDTWKYQINELNAQYTFWDGEVNFGGAIFNKYTIFNSANFGKEEVYFGESIFNVEK